MIKIRKIYYDVSVEKWTSTEDYENYDVNIMLVTYIKVWSAVKKYGKSNVYGTFFKDTIGYYEIVNTNSVDKDNMDDLDVKESASVLGANWCITLKQYLEFSGKMKL